MMTMPTIRMPEPRDIGPLFSCAYDGFCEDCGNQLLEGDRAGYVESTLFCEDCWHNAREEADGK